MAPPAFSDIAKPSSDLLSKDFYHVTAAKVDVKSKAPNGVSFGVKGTNSHDGKTSGSIEGKYADPSAGKSRPSRPLRASKSKSRRRQSRHRKEGRLRRFLRPSLGLFYRGALFSASESRGNPSGFGILMNFNRVGLTLTETWTTSNLLTTKIELDNQIAKGLKAEALTDFKPVDKDIDAKLNLNFKQQNFTGRAFFNLLKGPTANVDAVLGHEGFLVGVEAGYDVQKAAVTKYAAAIGYTAPQWSAAVTATNSLSVFAASYYHKVNAEVEAGAKAVWDSKAGNNVGLELAAKYRLDPASFAKAKVNDKGIAALAYNVKLSRGFTFGIGTSLDTKNLNEGAGAHKVGASFEFEG